MILIHTRPKIYPYNLNKPVDPINDEFIVTLSPTLGSRMSRKSHGARYNIAN